MFKHRGFEIKVSKKFPLAYEVSVPGVGGSVPDYLGSIYTSIGQAKDAIDLYLTPKPKREKNGRQAESKG